MALCIYAVTIGSRLHAIDPPNGGFCIAVPILCPCCGGISVGRCGTLNCLVACVRVTIDSLALALGLMLVTGLISPMSLAAIDAASCGCDRRLKCKNFLFRGPLCGGGAPTFPFRPPPAHCRAAPAMPLACAFAVVAIGTSTTKICCVPKRTVVWTMLHMICLGCVGNATDVADWMYCQDQLPQPFPSGCTVPFTALLCGFAL